MGTFRHASCAGAVALALLCACGGADSEEVAAAGGALREGPTSVLSSAELDRVRDANRASTAAERLRARMALVDELIVEQAGDLRTAAAGSGSGPGSTTNVMEDRFRSLREEIVERRAPPGDMEQIAREVAAGARGYEPTEGDRAIARSGGDDIGPAPADTAPAGR